MTLSTSRQQFLAYESHSPEDIQYGRRGGVFITTCVCVGFVISAVILAALVGVIVYFITYYKVSTQSQNTNFWDETEPFGQSNIQSADLRLPAEVVPSFYRLKLKADLDNSTFVGDVYITIRASKKVKEIILHSKGLSISNTAKLTEQIYEKVDTLHSRSKREVNETATNITATLQSNTSDIQSKATDNQSNASDIQSNVSDNNTIPENTSNATVMPPIISTTPVSNAVETVNETKANETEVRSNDTVPRETEEVAQPSPTDDHTQITHSSVRNIKIISITASTGDRVILTLASALKPDVDYTLELSFEGKISNSLTGFYKSSYTNNQHEVKNLGVTQFEPTSARAAFPCFDEPAFKAKFEISISHKRNVTVLSNMKAATEEFIADEPDWQWTHFERSVKMSTYLVAYILSDFKALKTTYMSKDNVTKVIQIWTRPELLHKAKYALTITPRLLEYYEEVFGVPYALDKIDLIAIPDFSSGAMENWGLVTFRETTLLFDETENSPRDKQNVAIDIAHELAHQWFGNLVTMQWWTDLWLNEGFATYIEYVGVDHIEPEWDMFESFSRDKMDLLRSDALKNTSPVSRQVIDASEISQKFDEISYTKGANLIRMLNHTISEELFHDGLVHYLNQWKYTNAVENDLWEAMATVAKTDPALSGRSLVNFMNSWTRQAGYPLVEVHRQYDTGDVTFEQKLFTSSKQPYKNMVDQLWQIPISYMAVNASLDERTTKPKLWLTERSKKIHVPFDATQALYVNVDAIGYYRVNYDQANWELLHKALNSGQIKSPITKAQLIDDAFNLAKASQLNYSNALGLTTCVINGENSKIVWDLLLNNMAFLKYNLRATSGYGHFLEYVKIILNKQLKLLNYGLDKPKDDNEAFLIENLVMWECYVESPRCLNWAREQFDLWAAQPDPNNNTIPSYLRSLVYNMALKHGGRREFDILWRVFQNSTDPAVKSLIITNLPSTRDESLVTMLLEKSLTEIPKQYAVAVWSVEPPVGTALAQRFLIENFSRVYRMFTAMDSFMFPAVLNGAFGLIATKQELDALKSFAVEHKEALMPMSQTLQKIVDTATLRVDWVQRHADNINSWFQQYVSDNIASTTEAAPQPSPPNVTKLSSQEAKPAPTTTDAAPAIANPAPTTANATNATNSSADAPSTPTP